MKGVAASGIRQRQRRKVKFQLSDHQAGPIWPMQTSVLLQYLF
jgi:hypothetical protein